MKRTMKFLAAGLLAGTLTFVGCKSNTSAEQGGTTTGDTGATGTGTDTGTGTGSGTGTGTGTGTNPGTGGSGDIDPGTGGSGADDIGQTKSTDDNLRMPNEDPLRTPQNESIRDAESESEPGIHDEPGIGGSGFGDDDATTDETLNPGGNVDDTLRTPGSPADIVPEDHMSGDSELPEDMR